MGCSGRDCTLVKATPLDNWLHTATAARGGITRVTIAHHGPPVSHGAVSGLPGDCESGVSRDENATPGSSSRCAGPGDTARTRRAAPRGEHSQDKQAFWAENGVILDDIFLCH